MHVVLSKNHPRSNILKGTNGYIRLDKSQLRTTLDRPKEKHEERLDIKWPNDDV